VQCVGVVHSIRASGPHLVFMDLWYMYAH
jgi:hypothetical protein